MSQLQIDQLLSLHRTDHPTRAFLSLLNRPENCDTLDSKPKRSCSTVESCIRILPVKHKCTMLQPLTAQCVGIQHGGDMFVSCKAQQSASTRWLGVRMKHMLVTDYLSCADTAPLFLFFRYTRPVPALCPAVFLL